MYNGSVTQRRLGRENTQKLSHHFTTTSTGKGINYKQTKKVSRNQLKLGLPAVCMYNNPAFSNQYTTDNIITMVCTNFTYSNSPKCMNPYHLSQHCSKHDQMQNVKTSMW